MSTTITADTMTSDATDTTAQRLDDDRWTVSDRPGVYSRNQAITAMSVAELRARTVPGPNDEIRIANYEQELLVPVMPRDPWALLQTLRLAAVAAAEMMYQPNFYERPFLGNFAEVYTAAAATVDRLTQLAERCGQVGSERAQGVTIGSAGQVEFLPDSTPAQVGWALSADAGETATASLRKAGSLLQVAGEQAREAQGQPRPAARRM